MNLRRTDTTAFSLIELLVVIAIMGVLAALAVPAIQGMGASQTLGSAADEIALRLETARAEAVMRGTPVWVGFATRVQAATETAAGNATFGAAGAGTVVYAGRMGGYGNMVVVDHGFDLKTVYAHLAAIYAGVGHRVRAGDLIGAVGQSGRTTGPHLHYEVRVGAAPIDPMCYLDGAGRQARPLALTVGG